MRSLKITRSITPRSQRSLQHYLSEIQNYEPLTPDQELELFKRYRAGDMQAHETLVLCNLRFVVSVAKQYMYCGMSLNDLINEGNEGLLIAVKRFDETKGFKFISYAVWWIRQRIMDSINKRADKIRKPANQRQVYFNIMRTRERLTQHLEREPSLEELGEEMEMEPDRIELCLRRHQKTAALDAPFMENEDATLHGVLEDKKMRSPDARLASDESAAIYLQHMMQRLDPKEREVIELNYGLAGKRQQHISGVADHFGQSVERVRQIRAKALSKLRRMSVRYADNV
jgi:RNA polymerase primary sigma factor